ncbi:DUF6896 domain-containing protein [Polaromonas sp. CT11-55]|uniref:DUF6896 domain-containing protein n=1 Tax=Polaromonas sp. CT11-55 TaxID=3243045 RepID=UPI0039A6EE1B
MNSSPVELARSAIPLWYANVAWAKELLVRSFNLKDPQDILRAPNRRFQQIPNTCWFVRPHGIGVHVFKTPDAGGVDFDFDKPHPDEWRLARFIEAQVNDGQLPFELYRQLVEDEEVMKSSIQEALRGV